MEMEVVFVVVVIIFGRNKTGLKLADVLHVFNLTVLLVLVLQNAMLVRMDILSFFSPMVLRRVKLVALLLLVVQVATVPQFVHNVITHLDSLLVTSNASALLLTI